VKGERKVKKQSPKAKKPYRETYYMHKRMGVGRFVSANVVDYDWLESFRLKSNRVGVRLGLTHPSKLPVGRLEESSNLHKQVHHEYGSNVKEKLR